MALKKRTFSDIKKKFSKGAKFKPNRFFDLGATILMEVPSMEGTLDPDLPFG